MKKIIRNKQRGFTFIGMLLALVIILILTGNYFQKDKDTQKTWAQTNIDKGSNAACAVNRQQVKTHIQMYSINNSDRDITIEKLSAGGYNVATCPDRGVYTIGENNEVYCSIHFPAPVKQEVQVTNEKPAEQKAEQPQEPQKPLSPEEQSANDVKSQVNTLLRR